MNQEEINELHKIRLSWFISKGLKPSQMMAYLTPEFIGTLAMQGYSDEFVKKTFERMYESYLKHPLRKENLKEK